MSNSNGRWASSSGDPDLEGDEGDEQMYENLDLEPDSPGWDDVEEDVENIAVKCLQCADEFRSVEAMLRHCKLQHGFDFISQVKQHSTLCSSTYSQTWR